ncbi:MAG: di/tricarboxylate transporter, partial [Planctomycetota bacterium]
MESDAIITLVVLGCMVVLLLTEWIPPGVTGLLTIAALAATNVLPSRDAFSGLSNPAVVTVGCMYVLSAAVSRTGAAALVADRIADSKRGGTPLGAYYGILAITMLLSGFVNNTPLVVIFLPLVLGLAHRTGEAPSRMLIPLSFVSILGGACTLIGTSTNLVVAASLFEVSGGEMEIGMFDFAPLGVILALSGGLLIVVFRKRMLPVRTSLDLPTRQGLAVEYMTELEIHDDSPLLGKNLQEVVDESLLGVPLNILEVVRGEVIRIPRPEVVLKRGDLLLVKGSPEAVLQLRLAEGARRGKGGGDSVRNVALTLFEVVVTPESNWIGQKLSTLEMRDRFDSSIFAIQRHGTHLREELGRLRLLAGDVLLVQGSDDSLRRLRTSVDALVVEGVDQIAPDTRRAPFAMLALALFVALAVTR